MLNRLFATSRARWFAVVAVYLIGAAITIVCGTLRHTDTFLFDHDARFWFLGGVMWLKGDSPYAHEAFLRLWVDTFGEPPRFRSGFVYPGTILPLSLLLGAFQWETARWVMRLLNFAAYAAALLVLRGTFARGPESAEVRVRRELWIGASAAVPGVALTMFQGQMALLVTLGVCLTWAGFRSGRTAMLFAGMFLASLKPQLAIVAVLFLFACFPGRRGWLSLLAVAVAGAAVLLWTTPAQFVADLGGSLAEHTSQEFNLPDNYDSLVARVGTGTIGRVVQWAGVLGGCAAAVVLGTRVRSSRLPQAEIRFFQIALAITAVVMPVHRYDLVIELPLVATAWALGSNWRAAGMFLLVMAHGWATWMCWHLENRFGIAIDYHTVAGYVAAAELVALVFWWHRDSARLGNNPEPNPSSPELSRSWGERYASK